EPAFGPFRPDISLSAVVGDRRLQLPLQLLPAGRVPGRERTATHARAGRDCTAVACVCGRRDAQSQDHRRRTFAAPR
ncbi:MAG: Cyclic pyranopterin phosphate synthase (MoaA), partial [uncultured Lysobacter sp.]